MAIFLYIYSNTWRKLSKFIELLPLIKESHLSLIFHKLGNNENLIESESD